MYNIRDGQQSSPQLRVAIDRVAALTTEILTIRYLLFMVEGDVPASVDWNNQSPQWPRSLSVADLPQRHTPSP